MDYPLTSGGRWRDYPLSHRLQNVLGKRNDHMISVITYSPPTTIYGREWLATERIVTEWLVTEQIVTEWIVTGWILTEQVVTE